MTRPVDLADFLLARIAEDEATAMPFRSPDGVAAQWRCDEIGGKVRQVGPMEFGLPDVISESDTHLTAAHIARHDPARVLAECAAKRAVVEYALDVLGGAWTARAGVTVPTTRPDRAVLLLLAQPYANHPEYDPEWRPAD